MTNVDRVFQVELFCESREIIGVGVHVIPVPRLGGAAVSAPVMRDDSETLLAEEQHLCVPVVCGERPAVAENDGLSRAPVFVENLCAIFHSDCGHKVSLKILVGTESREKIYI